MPKGGGIRRITTVDECKPLKILHLKQSHCKFNSEFALIQNGKDMQPAILLYNMLVPSEDPIMVLAHELGHALHYSLTKDINVLPEKFDELMQISGKSGLDILERKHEAFADLTAWAILSDDELKEHLPLEITEDFAAMSTEYVSFLTSNWQMR
ncbi:MAG: hypothetical protein LBU32_00775 [Clostridiales bacterium]|jgi:hypothetical protein|nr:hypothetical protein [Clostridiales bacterium]